jgi:capsular polysaccharide transport system ATP-binding protein
MIRLANVNKDYHTRVGPVRILRDVHLTVRAGERIGILGRNGAGKSTLIRLIGGAELPTSGLIERGMSVSWPLAFGGAFQGSLTGLDNLRFICRIYGVDPDGKIDFVQEFSELGLYLREPVKTYSSGMRARLAFAISMVINFDCFLIDEIVAVGDARFHEKCNHELFVNRGDRAMIIVSHNADYIREHCSRAAVLVDGELHHAPSLDEAFAFYTEQSAIAA